MAEENETQKQPMHPSSRPPRTEAQTQIDQLIQRDHSQIERLTKRGD